jgi:hypothetical protein
VNAGLPDFGVEEAYPGYNVPIEDDSGDRLLAKITNVLEDNEGFRHALLVDGNACALMHHWMLHKHTSRSQQEPPSQPTHPHAAFLFAGKGSSAGSEEV